jgi:hypothetical protein
VTGVIYYTYLSPQFFCLLKPIPKVFLLMLITIGPYVFNYLLYLLKATFLYTGCHSKPCPKNAVVMSMLLLCQPVQDRS